MQLIRALILALLCAPSTASADPNTGGTPLYGTVALQAGFTPDPRAVRVTAGGDTDARRLSLPAGCTGFITPGQPDVRLNWTAGRAALRLAVCSNADTSLIINDSAGRWHCADDVEGTNPVLDFSGESGQFDIWVGGARAGAGRPATLRITERVGRICD